MGKHVDTNRPVDTHYRSFYAPLSTGPMHRKPGSPMVTFGIASDVWSGNPDTDRAWVHRGLLGRDRGWINPDSPIEFFD